MLLYAIVFVVSAKKVKRDRVCSNLAEVVAALVTFNLNTDI